ncbi:MAG: COX15/CtaA family protein [Candidatus Eisenbacteria bacterium]
MDRSRYERGAFMALAFGTTTAMWAVGYICRFPSVQAPAWITVPLMLLCLFLGGTASGRWTGDGWRAGAKTGLVASILNLLILGSLLGGAGPGRTLPAAWLWVPGTIALGVILGAAGGAWGGRGARGGTRNWTGAFARVSVAATFLLLIAGGIVTGAKAGLDVPDWPTSYGYNMFLYPLAKMSGGIYYEHAHRLLGSLVGLTTIWLAFHLLRVESRLWLKRLGLLAVFLVLIQGFLGGMRVTGYPTLETAREALRPNLFLALVHGVTGQIFFGLLVAISVFLADHWLGRTEAAPKRTAGTDRSLAALTTALIVAQIVLGAVQRHLAGGLHMHIFLAVVVLGVGVATGARAWGLYEDVPVVSKTGKVFVMILGTQMILGILAWIASGSSPEGGPASAFDVTVTTIHQATGAALLAHAVMLWAWLHRMVKPASAE